MATTSYDAGYSGADAYDVRGGGWITFAAVMLGLASVLSDDALEYFQLAMMLIAALSLPRPFL